MRKTVAGRNLSRRILERKSTPQGIENLRRLAGRALMCRVIDFALAFCLYPKSGTRMGGAGATVDLQTGQKTQAWLA